MNKKKLLFEIIIIPLCILYLLLFFLKSELAAFIIYSLFAVVTTIWFVPKYIEELYIYESKNNLLKLLFVISDIALIILLILNIILKTKLLKILLVIFTALIFIELLHYGIKNLKEVIKKKKEYGINILSSFSTFCIVAIMLSTIIIYLK